MLKIFDRYIIRQFLGTFFFILALIMAIAIVFDISEKTNDFTRMEASLWVIIFDYYVNFVVYYANLFSGLFIFLAVLIFTSRLAQRTEVIATLSGGVSFLRFLYPFFVSATILTGIAFVTNHYILPDANRVRLAFMDEHIHPDFYIMGRDHHRRIAPGIIAYSHDFRMTTSTAYTFSLESWSDDGQLLSKLTADRAEYDSIAGVWTAYYGMIRNLGEEQDEIIKFTQIDTVIDLTPSDFGRRVESYAAMKTPVLIDYIEEQKRRGGTDIVFAEIERYQRTSMPFSTYVFTLIGVSLASRKVRGGTGVHIALGVVLILIYIFSIKLTTVAATNAGMDPRWAVWVPNILFGLVGLYIYHTAPK